MADCSCDWAAAHVLHGLDLASWRLNLAASSGQLAACSGGVLCEPVLRGLWAGQSCGAQGGGGCLSCRLWAGLSVLQAMDGPVCPMYIQACIWAVLRRPVSLARAILMGLPCPHGHPPPVNSPHTPTSRVAVRKESARCSCCSNVDAQHLRMSADSSRLRTAKREVGV